MAIDRSEGSGGRAADAGAGSGGFAASGSGALRRGRGLDLVASECAPSPAPQCETISEALAADTPQALREAYAAMAAADFSRDVLARQLGIAVTDVTDSGFSEIATLEQVLTAFPGLSDRCQLGEPPRVAEPPHSPIYANM